MFRKVFVAFEASSLVSFPRMKFLLLLVFIFLLLPAGLPLVSAATGNNNTSLTCGEPSGVIASHHTTFFFNRGKLYGMGRNEYGQLGLGHTNPVPRPEELTAIVPNVVTIFAGSANHAMWLTKNGTLYGVGNNDEGQLGVGHRVAVHRPTQVINGSNVRMASLFFGATIFVKTDGTIWAMGYNNNGRLGLDPAGGVPQQQDGWDNILEPEQLVENITSGGGEDFHFVPIRDVVTASVGPLHMVFVKADGSLWGAGANIYRAVGPCPGSMETGGCQVEGWWHKRMLFQKDIVVIDNKPQMKIKSHK